MPTIPEKPTLSCGVYIHFKSMSKRYIALAIAYAEQSKPLVLYRQLYAPYGFWVRPYRMFMEHVLLESGRRVKRFKPCKKRRLKERCLKVLLPLVGDKTAYITHSETLERYYITSIAADGTVNLERLD